MRVLIACEESQEVCKAFRNRGHEAFSCDLLPASGGHPEWHIQGDCLPILNDGWDLVIGHPPCTRLTNSVIWYIKKHGLFHEVDEAAEFFKKILHCNAKRICVENPIPHGYAQNKIEVKYSQTIQPYNFGEDASKRTCLWLKGLPKLVNTEYFPPRIVDGKKRWGNQTDGGWNKLPPDNKETEGLRALLRSKTYPGIAKAMAKQWG